MIQNNELSLGHGKVLLSLQNEEDILRLAAQIKALGLSVRQTEEVVFAMEQPEKPKPVVERVVDPNVREAELQLQRALGCKVQISDRKGKGKVVIQYSSLEDFDRILEVLKN